MRSIHKSLRLDMHRAIFSIRFFVTYIGVTLVLLMGSISELDLAKDTLYLFKYSLEVSGFGHMLPLLSAIPYASSFAIDYSSRYFRAILIRANHNGYAWSKVVSCSVSGGAAIALGLITFLVICASQYPLVSVDAANYEYFAQQTLGGDLLTGPSPTMYFLVYVVLIFFSSAFWSGIGLCVSSFIPNVFVAYSAAFILSYFTNIFTYHFPLFLRLNKVTEGTVILKTTSLGLIYAICLFTLLTVLVGCITQRAIRRRIQNG